VGGADRISGRFILEADLPDAEAESGRTHEITVNTLKLICLAIFRLVKRACLLPQSVVDAVKQRRQRMVRNELEVERLDRIRNPSKYLGK
jgi:hypothetical protein